MIESIILHVTFLFCHSYKFYNESPLSKEKLVLKGYSLLNVKLLVQPFLFYSTVSISLHNVSFLLHPFLFYCTVSSSLHSVNFLAQCRFPYAAISVLLQSLCKTCLMQSSVHSLHLKGYDISFLQFNFTYMDIFC